MLHQQKPSGDAASHEVYYCPLQAWRTEIIFSDFISEYFTAVFPYSHFLSLSDEIVAKIRMCYGYQELCSFPCGFAFEIDSAILGDHIMCS